MTGELLAQVTVLVLAAVIGFELISRVPALLHTPLMSATNAIHGVVLVGAIVVLLGPGGAVTTILGLVAVVLATVNVVGGFVVTGRMLEMFKPRTGAGRRRG
jgi:NAD(P) transhydrogenase subunit alpha